LGRYTKDVGKEPLYKPLTHPMYAKLYS
jgi:hypothetical protein